MKYKNILTLTLLLGAILIFQSCTRTSSDVWEDTKSASRHMKRGVNALVGRSSDSRLVNSRGDFESYDDEDGYQLDEFQQYPYQDDYIPLEGSIGTYQIEMQTPPPRQSPGEPGSSIPGIEAFRDPSTVPQLSGAFHTIYFEYNKNEIKGQLNLEKIHTTADFLRNHPHINVFIEGHCDERGPQAYNLALGARRANSVRDMLIHEGVNPDRLFTISYGKERPAVLEHHEEAWSKNRRAEFKVYGH